MYDLPVKTPFSGPRDFSSDCAPISWGDVGASCLDIGARDGGKDPALGIGCFGGQIIYGMELLKKFDLGVDKSHFITVP